MSNENSNKRLTSNDYESAEKNSFGERPTLQFPPEFDMILAYREKMKLISESISKKDFRTDPLDEVIGLVLDPEKIKKITSQKGFHSLAAFFAVEDSENPLSKNTLVIMGLDKDANLLPYDLEHGIFTQAQETWSAVRIGKVDNEDSFQEFFRIKRKD